MQGKGLYRRRGRDAEFAFVDYGVPSNIGEIPRSDYEAEGHQPPFDQLPTLAQYQAKYANKRRA